MSAIEIWIKLLYTYGPFALLVFFMFVAERKARRAWRDASGEEGSLPIIIVYLLNWLVIFGLVGFAVYAWYRINLSSESTIHGKFENLQGSETVTSRSDPLYLRRVYSRNGRFNYEWRLITPKKLADGSIMQFTFDRSTHESDLWTDHELTIHSYFYESGVRIIYDRGAEKLFLMSDNKKEELPPLEELGVVEPRWLRGFLFGTAYAQEPFSPEDFVIRLESNDVIIRREARTDLASLGKTALPWIQYVLADDKSSYRLRLGVIITLNKIGDLSNGVLSPSALATMVYASVHPDPTLSRQARRYIENHPSWELDTELDRIRVDARAQITSSNSDSSRVAQFAQIEFDILYKLGMFEKDQYVSLKPVQTKRIDRAIAAFKKAWKLRWFVPQNERPVFLKALYGWGYALHERSWIERRPDSKRDQGLVTNAKKKFGEFLIELGKLDDPNVYPYTEHFKHARAYQNKPVPKSLQ